MAHHPDLGPGPGGYKEEPAPVAGDPVSTASIRPLILTLLYHRNSVLVLASGGTLAYHIVPLLQ